MRNIMLLLLVAGLALGLVILPGGQGFAQSSDASKLASDSSSSALAFYGRLQTLGFLQNLTDHYRDNTRVYLYLKQARLGARATYKDVDFDVQFALGGEDVVKAPSPGVALSLLDLSADIPVTKSWRIKAGQFKVPYGRENLTDEGMLQFTDVSIQFLGFKLGRDVGIALHGNCGTFTSIVGVFTAGGRDVPIRYIPIDLGFPMVVARVGINDGLDENLFNIQQNLVESSSGYALFLNGLYTKDSKVGHSTALNVKLDDKSLLLNSNWNPYMEKGISAEAEINYGTFKNGYGSLAILGGRVQGAYFTNPFEIAGRYSFLRPDENFGVRDNLGTVYQILDSKLIQELTASVSYYLHGNRVKLTAELPIFINEPVITEPNLGTYPLIQQPDQVALAGPPTKAPVERQTVVEARLQLQVSF
ncbi:MAG: hypothetical protein E6K56_02225 [Ignavibacteria bacterium]|nr:MAG: hypothetical protein E6K56_02225 [Ignavibacteria bacterium]